jgi:PAS domain S-box-containing protein
MHAERAPLTTAHLQAIFDLAPIGIANVGRDGRFLRANPALVRFLGYPLETLQTLTFATLTHPDDRPVSDAAFAGLVEGTQSEFVIEKRYRCADGRYAWVLVTGAAVRDDLGAFAYFVSLVEDIADRKATEAALSASESRFRALFEQAPYGVLLADATGHPLMANRAYRAIFALADDAPLPHTLADDSRLAASGIVPLLGRALDGEAVSVPPQRYDLLAASRPSAPPLWLAVRLHPLRDGDGAVREVALLFEDVTEQYQTAEALRATNESLEQRVAERTRELTALLDITREVASTLDLEPLLGLILDRLVGLVDATMLAVTVLDGEELARASIRSGDVSRSIAAALSGAPSRRVARSRSTMC